MTGHALQFLFLAKGKAVQGEVVEIFGLLRMFSTTFYWCDSYRKYGKSICFAESSLFFKLVYKTKNNNLTTKKCFI